MKTATEASLVVRLAAKKVEEYWPAGGGAGADDSLIIDLPIIDRERQLVREIATQPVGATVLSGEVCCRTMLQYYHDRANGDEQDWPDRPLPLDGCCKIEKERATRVKVTYVAGVEDHAWMADMDANWRRRAVSRVDDFTEFEQVVSGYLDYRGFIPTSKTSTGDHYEQGPYEFVRWVLQLNLQHIDRPRRDLPTLPARRSRAAASVSTYSQRDDSQDSSGGGGGAAAEAYAYDAHTVDGSGAGSRVDTAAYYSDLINLIYEEARAQIAQGIEKFNDKKFGHKENLRFQELKLARNPERPSKLIFRGGLQRARDVSYSQLVLLMFTPRGERILGVGQLNDDNTWLTVRVILPAEIHPQTAKQQVDHYYNSDSRWGVVLLCSVVSQMRMFTVCHEKFHESSQLMRAIIAGDPTQLEIARRRSDTELEYAASHGVLNELQQQVVERFMQLQEGMQFVQGPPGTGKSATIDSLLETLQLNGAKTLVCAPSNKAVQVLVRRFLEQNPDVPILLVGVDKKIPLDLQHILLGTMLENWLSELYGAIDMMGCMDPDRALSDETTVASFEQSMMSIADRIINVAKVVQKYGVGRQFFNSYRLQEIGRRYANCLKFFKCIDAEARAAYQESRRQEQDPPAAVAGAIKNFKLAQSYFRSNVKSVADALDVYKGGDARRSFDATLMNNSPIVFCTLIVAGRELFRQVRRDVLIVDEAAQAVEAETLISLIVNPRKVLLVGDTKQLPATVISQHALRCHFDWSLMYRLIVENGAESLMLERQYRMHPYIRAWPSQRFYEGRLQDDISIARRDDHLRGLPLLGPCKFFDGPSPEERYGTSFRNCGEADIVLVLAELLKTQLGLEDYSSIGIISFYSGQVEYISAIAKGRRMVGLTVNSVDGFQGDERDFIIISFVRANPKARVGFLSDFRRLNVAITRAKLGLFMFGNVRTLERSGNKDLQSLVTNLRSRGLILTTQELREAISSPRPAVVGAGGGGASAAAADTPATRAAAVVATADTGGGGGGGGGRRTPDAVSEVAAAIAAVLTQGQGGAAAEGAAASAASGQTRGAQRSGSEASARRRARRGRGSGHRTQLCRFFERQRPCPHGDACKFAHGADQLLPR